MQRCSRRRVALELVQERIEKCSILAPIDGTVLRVYASAPVSRSVQSLRAHCQSRGYFFLTH